MKKLILTFLLIGFIVPVCNAQSDLDRTSDPAHCSTMADTLYNTLLTSDNNLKFKKTDAITDITTVSLETISDRSGMNEYSRKINDKQNYVYTYDPKIEGIKLIKVTEITDQQNKSAQEGYDFMKEKLSSALNVGSKIVETEIKIRSGKTFADYTVCSQKQDGTPTYQLAYNNAFFGLLFFKVETSKSIEVSSTDH
jgi:hypothetical protein